MRAMIIGVGLLGLMALPLDWHSPSLAAVRAIRVAGPVARGRSASLKDQLEKGLKARRPQEFAFIARVVTLVEQGILPRTLVDSTFLWARSARHPFQYFERGLRVRARRLGIPL
jgi:hypothetical protein